ncbi:putrescine oxidase [Rothia kristinae]|uniref:Putrescine oxidase n=2 Tax=Rothia kristinae TaxID=37923 RepID=A0A1S2MYW3_9MICC|nr:NAD(P)/FAD-dependent oxidoreductase [Rothia kristinae]OIJ35518.1 putrescine oxidase [Rothia kristinae]
MTSSTPTAHPDWPTREVDVVVIGAGPSGLNAARDLKSAGKSVAVLEARQRVGGRTWSKKVDGHFLEIGGQWISPDQTALLELVRELGLRTYSRYRDGESVYRAPDGTVTRYTGEMFPASEQTQAEMARLIGILDDLAAQIGPHEPWAHPLARELDTISFHHWLREQSADEEACQNIGLFIAGGMLTKPAHAFSALQAVLMAASAGSFSNLVDEDFILDERVLGGMQSVSTTIAEQLGEDVILEHPVRVLRWQEEGTHPVLVEAEHFTENGEADGGGVLVRARRAVVAVPPNLYERISFVPALPRRQQQMHQHQSLGLVIKVHAVYETPFWRDKGLSGTAFAADHLVQEVYDNTHWDPATGQEHARGTLVGFVSDEKADAMFELTAEQRKAAILDAIAELLGEEAKHPVVYYESDWGAEEWTRGAYAASYDLGGLHRYGADQNAPVGPIHWSCSDIAAEGYQHVDGAVRMGRKTAREILEQL